MSALCDCGTTGCDPCVCGHPWSDHDSSRDRVCHGEWCDCKGFDQLIKAHVYMPPVAEGPTMTDEAQTTCDCCGKVAFWEDLATGDDGETWLCPSCVPAGAKP